MSFWPNKIKQNVSTSSYSEHPQNKMKLVSNSTPRSQEGTAFPLSETADGSAVHLALELEQLQKKFGQLQVINGLSLQLPNYARLALIGPSGCGKSTLLNLVSGLDRSYQGRIWIAGKELAENSERVPSQHRAESGFCRRFMQKISHKFSDQISSRPHVGYMLQKDLLLPWRNIEQNVFLPQELQHLPTYSCEEVNKLFGLFGLEQFRTAYPRQLSGGMRQRANLLRTYTLKSDLLLLDEPFGALDALTKQSLGLWFLEMSAQQPRSILMVTHDIREAILLADEVLVLSMRPCRAIAQFDVRTITSPKATAELEQEIFSYLQ